MPGPELNQSVKQALEQKLSTRQLQSLSLLHLPLLALQEEIHQELEKNPVLEDISQGSSESLTEMTDRAAQDRSEDFPAGDDDAETASLSQSEDEWLDDVPLPPEQESEESARSRSAFLNGLAEEPDLQSQLLAELAMSGLSPAQQKIGEAIIGSLDDNGYLVTPLADIAMGCDVEMDEVESILKIVQTLAPAGIGARDLSECLLLQMHRKHWQEPLAETLAAHYLDEIARNKLPQIAKELSVTPEELNAALAKLRTLDPHPGLRLSSATAGFVLPEAEIVPDSKGFKAVPCDEYQPRLHLSSRYLKMLEDPTLSPEDRAYLKEKVDAANELIRSLSMRRSTILRIADLIAREQGDFFREGVEKLRPMTMKEAAEELELHETTVSRATAGKFLASPQGLLEFRFFFSGGYHTKSGEDLSSRAVMEKIREIVAREDSRKPLSDDRIAALLKEAGFSVARRTVAKYRDILHISATPLRRKHF